MNYLVVLILSYLIGVTAHTPYQIGLWEEEPETVVSFYKDVMPIFEQKCNQTNCHGPRGFPQFNSYKRIKAKAKKINSRIVSKILPMPPADAEQKLTSEELRLLQQWIAAGAPEN